MKRLLLVAISAVALATASHHKTIEADKLEVGKIYQAEVKRLPIYTMGPFGWVSEPAHRSKILKIIAKGKSENGIWYDVLNIKPETFDRSLHIRGRILASDLAKGEIFILP